MIALVEEAHQLSGQASGLELFGIMDMREFSVLLETDTDPTLFAKWGWHEGNPGLQSDAPEAARAAVRLSG